MMYDETQERYKITAVKTSRQLERIVKGFSNHRRIEILILLNKSPELSLQEIADDLGINFRTASEHTRRLSLSGLILKRYEGNVVRHVLSPQGKTILKFLRTLE
jgi:predicted ArsR family transcriptional regulator